MSAGRRPRVGPELAVMVSLGMVSVLNYVYTAVLVWMLPARQYAVVGAVASLLLVCGTVASASVPWVLAREIVRAGDDHRRRRAAVSFCLLGTAAEALAAGLVTGTIAAAYGNPLVVAVVIGAVVAIFTSATTCGYLQGFERFGLIAGLKLAEVVIKLGAGILLVRSGGGAVGAVAGFALGSGVVAVVGLGLMRPDLRLLRSSLTDRSLWSAAGGLMAIQSGVAVLASLDVIVGSLAIDDRAHLATYEVAQILSRIPVFVATALSIIVFPRLVHPGPGRVERTIGDNLGLWLRVCVPLALVAATLPGAFVDRLFPSGYGDVSAVLAFTAVAGLALGAVNLLSTYFQAADVYRRPCQILALGGAGLVVGAVAGIHLDGIRGLAGAVCVGSGAVAAGFAVLTHRHWPGSFSGLWRSAAAPLVAGLPLVALHGQPVIWAAWAAGALALPAVVTVGRFRHHVAGDARPRVLHLGFEDPRRPGAGGGSVRTHEINRRLAGELDITVVCARYRGCRPRVEDGVRYVHAGLPFGYLPGVLAYFAAIPWVLARWDSDLVVEDFAAPFSSVAVPWLTRRPVVGVVQWLFAREKAGQYRVPFHLVEQIGIRSHRELVAVSEDLGAELCRRQPRARVTVVPNGLADEAFTPRHQPRADVVYLGRLESAQKGLDLLLEAWARVAPQLTDDLILAGDGPDEATLRAQAAALGLEGRVRFVGRVAGGARFELLAGACVVAMPSRYETFGMVAAEALAVATPVVAFSIPCLGNLVDGSCGILVPAFDPDALGDALVGVLSDPVRARDLGAGGPAVVAGLRWDELAGRQADVYRRAMGHAGPVAAVTAARPVLDRR